MTALKFPLSFKNAFMHVKSEKKYLKDRLNVENLMYLKHVKYLMYKFYCKISIHEKVMSARVSLCPSFLTINLKYKAYWKKFEKKRLKCIKRIRKFPFVQD